MVYTSFGSAAAALVGWLLALSGSQVGSVWRVGIACGFAMLAVGEGTWELLTRKPLLLQLNRETSQAWMNLGPLGWAAANGAAIGTGIVSRIGFPLWYVVPAACFISGAPIFGALSYLAYGAVRTASAWLFLHHENTDSDSVRLVTETHRRAQTVAAGYLLFVGLVVITSWGVR